MITPEEIHVGYTTRRIKENYPRGVHKGLSMKVKGSSTGGLLINEPPKPNGRRETNTYEEVKEKIAAHGGGENIVKRVKACWLKYLQCVEAHEMLIMAGMELRS